MKLRFYFKHIFDTNVEKIATQRLERVTQYTRNSNVPKQPVTMKTTTDRHYQMN
ncbi:MAG: hypothetical protein PQ964_06080 [Methanobacteriaceae archaeon]